LLTLNESEARHYTGEYSLMRAARQLLAMGPGHVLVKKGEHGSLLFSRAGLYVLPGYPLEEVHDPTGAGDSFAGAFMGVLAAADAIDEAAMRRALVYANVVAAFGVEAFSLDRLQDLTLEQIEARVLGFQAMTRFG
jgi:sugar/nucleoside kinase (ribokinase family)